MDDLEQPAPPSRAAKLAATLAFFAFLFLAAGAIGLPMPTSLVVVFFITVAGPAAFVIALLVAAMLRAFRRASGKPQVWPLFDVALQTFIVLSLLSLGVFVVRFPGWLRGNYTMIRAEVESYLANEVGAAERTDFLQALDRFWSWNVDAILEESEPPSEIEQQQVRDTLAFLREAITPACSDCQPELDAGETSKLTAMMNALTLGAAQPGISEPNDIQLAPPPATAPSAAPGAPAAVTR